MRRKRREAGSEGSAVSDWGREEGIEMEVGWGASKGGGVEGGSGGGAVGRGEDGECRGEEGGEEEGAATSDPKLDQVESREERPGCTFS